MKKEAAYSVLILDDEIMVLRSLEAALKMRGFKSPSAAVPALAKNLKSPDKDAVISTLEALIYLGRKSLPALDNTIALLDSKDSLIINRACQLLSIFGHSADKALPKLKSLSATALDDYAENEISYLISILEKKK